MRLSVDGKVSGLLTVLGRRRADHGWWKDRGRRDCEEAGWSKNDGRGSVLACRAAAPPARPPRRLGEGGSFVEVIGGLRPPELLRDWAHLPSMAWIYALSR